MKKVKAWLVKNWISILALIIAFSSAWFTYEQAEITKKVAHVHIQPDLSVLLDLPLKGNPVLVITNQGDIPVASLSIAHELFVFNPQERKVVSACKAGRWLGDKMVYKDLLKPMEYVSCELVDVTVPEGFINIYKFDVRFYRSEDMKAYSKQKLFFVKNRKVLRHGEFRGDPNYTHIMESITQFTFPEAGYNPGALKTLIEAWNESKEKSE